MVRFYGEMRNSDEYDVGFCTTPARVVENLPSSRAFHRDRFAGMSIFQ